MEGFLKRIAQTFVFFVQLSQFKPVEPDAFAPIPAYIDLYSAIVLFNLVLFTYRAYHDVTSIFWLTNVMRSSVNFMDRNREAGLAGQLRFHCFDNVVRHERLAVVLADVTVRGETGFASEVTGELTTLIVLNHNHILTAPENFPDFRHVQRHNPFNRELIGHDPFFGCEFFHRFTDYPRSRAPTDKRDISLLRTNEFRRRDVVDRALHFAGAFLHHHPPLLRIGEFITDERAVFIVLVGRGGKNVPGHSRHRAGRNSARRVLITQIRLVVVTAAGIGSVSLLRQGYGGQAVAVRQDQFTPVD